MMRPVDRIIVHCSATPAGRDFTVADIDRWHKARGYASIGYHYVVYRDGTVHEGRRLESPGAHTKGYNTTSVGVCYIGGLSADGSRPEDTRTPQQRLALRALVDGLCRRFPKATVHGHYEFAAKACPSFKICDL